MFDVFSPCICITIIFLVYSSFHIRFSLGGPGTTLKGTCSLRVHPLSYKTNDYDLRWIVYIVE